MKKMSYGEDYYLEGAFDEEWAKSRYNKERRRQKRTKNLEYNSKRGHKSREYTEYNEEEYDY